MASTQRKCAAPDCQRRPQSGWAFCTDHLDAYLDRAMRIGQWQREEDPLPKEAPTTAVEPRPLPDLRDWAPGEITEVFGR